MRIRLPGWKLRAWRKMHDDRDPHCMYFWGDRSGYPLFGSKAPVCRQCRERGYGEYERPAYEHSKFRRSTVFDRPPENVHKIPEGEKL